MSTTPPATADTQVLAQAAQALSQSVRTHKRAVAHHRREGRRSARALEDLRAELARRGVALVIDGAEETHGHST
ncbi:MAG: hypothetical protein RIB67_07475 [Miltoncostaeaceae bacterium]